MIINQQGCWSMGFFAPSLILCFGVLMGWAQVRLLSFASLSNLKIWMLPLITKKNTSRIFLDIFLVWKSMNNLDCKVVDQKISIHIYKFQNGVIKGYSILYFLFFPWKDYCSFWSIHWTGPKSNVSLFAFSL